MERRASERGYPSLTAREHWGSYFGGVVTESGYVLALAAAGLVLALMAEAVWR